MPLQPVNNRTVSSSQYAFIGSPVAIVSRSSITCDAGHYATFIGIVSQRDAGLFATDTVFPRCDDIYHLPSGVEANG